MARVELHVEQAGGRVIVDGHDVSRAVKGFRLDGRPGASALALDVVLHEATVQGEAIVTVSETTRSVLIALGWTEPGAFSRSCGEADVSTPEGRHPDAPADGGR